MFHVSVIDCSILRLCQFYYYHFVLSPRPTCLCHFLDRFISPLLPPPISGGCRRNTSQLHPLPTSFPGTELLPPGCLPQPLTPPSSNACSAYRAVCLCLPLYFPPRCRPFPAPRSLFSPGSLPDAGPSVPLCPASLPV